MSDTPKGKFPKSAHLLKHADFQRVYKQGKRHFSGNLTVFYLRKSQESESQASSAATPEASARKGGRVRIGFTVPKALGSSVERNRMRRRTREAVRHHLSMLDGITEPLDVVINPKKSVLTLEFPRVSGEIEKAFRVIQQKTAGAAQRA